MDPSLQLLVLAVFPALVIVAAVHDLTTFTIPNWISLALVALFLPAALIAGLSLGQLGMAAAVGFVLLCVGIGMFAMGWIGGGDAKLLAAAGLWLGWPAALHFLAYHRAGGRRAGAAAAERTQHAASRAGAARARTGSSGSSRRTARRPTGSRSASAPWPPFR